MSIESWLIFVTIWFLTGIHPGPNALNCVAVSSSFGFRRALWCMMGIIIAAMFYILAVSAGLATVLLANAHLFTALKIAGGAYLIWIGIKTWRSAGVALSENAVSKQPKPAPVLVRDSVLISLSNPKAILAYGAVFSQFIDPQAALWPQLAVIGPTALGITALIYTAYCGLGSGIGRFLSSARRRLFFNRGTAAFFIFAGGGLVSTEIAQTLSEADKA